MENIVIEKKNDANHEYHCEQGQNISIV